MNDKQTVFNVKELEDKVCSMRNRGMPKHIIAERLRISQYRVRQILERNNINVRIEHGRRK